MPDRAVPTGAIVLVGAVLVLAAYGLWYRHTETERRLAAAVPSVPAELAPLAVPPKLPAPVAAKPDAAPAAQKPAAMPAPVVSATPEAAPAGNTQAAATPAAPALPVAAAPAPPATVATALPPGTPLVAAMPRPSPTPPAVLPGAGQAIVATADDWIEVRDATGNILFSKVLHAGQSWPVPNESGLTMTAGNAGGTEISANGKAGAPLGGMGVVLHNYVLTPPSLTGSDRNKIMELL